MTQNNDKNVKRIYMYSTNTYRTKGWIKVGDTIEEDVRVRVNQQKGAAVPEALTLIKEVPKEGLPLRDGDIRDHQFHDFLENEKNIERVDEGGGQEWFVFDPKDPEIHAMELYNEYFYDVVGKIDSYEPDEPQQDCLDKMMASWSNCVDKSKWSFGLFAKCRFGKTVTSYWFCNNLFEKIGKKKGIKIGVFSYKPNSVVEAWREPIERHVNFASYDFRDLREGIPETSRHANTIDFCSMQGLIDKKKLFGTSEEIEVEDDDSEELTTREERINHVLETEYDIIFFDEVHYGIRAEAARLFVEKMKSKNGFVYLSGTPEPMLKEGMFHADDQFVWTLMDETKYKRANPKSRLGKMPDMETYILDVSAYVKNEDVIDLYTEEDQFSHHKAQEVNEAGEYVYHRYWRTFLDIVQPVDSIRARSLSKYKYPTKLRTGALSPWHIRGIKSHELDTQVWVLNSVDSCTAMKKELEAHPYFSEYKIIQLTGGKKKWTEKSLNNKLNEYAQKGIKSICLTVEKFMEGVTIKPWASIWLLQDWTSSIRYGQSTLRVQNEYNHPRYGQKNVGRVFDFSVNRTLIVRVSEAQVLKGTKSENQYLRESLECSPVFDWNDNLQLQSISMPDLYKPLLKKNPAELITSTYMLNTQNLHKFAQELFKFSKTDFSKAVKKDLTSYRIESKQYKQTKKGTNTNPPGLKSESLQQLENRAKNLLKKLAYLVFLADSRIESVDDLYAINDETYELVYGSALNKTTLKSIIDRGLIDEHRLNQWLTMMVLKLHSPSVKNDLDEILDVLHTEGINKRTPPELVRDIIDRIPLEVLQNPNQVYLDPCCGQGIFLRMLAVKLDTVLASSMPDELSRRRHIWENMLHGYDNDKVQIRTARSIISKLGWFVQPDSIQYNIYNKDALKEEWGMKFNVIIGNPPYHKGKNHDFYVSFVKKGKEYLVNDGIMAFIVPNRIFIPSSKLHKELLALDVTDVMWDVSTKWGWNIKTFVGCFIAINRNQSGPINIDDEYSVLKNDILPSKSDIALNQNMFNIIKKVFSKPGNIFCKKQKNQFDLFITRQWRRWNSVTKKGGHHTFNPKKSKDGRWLICRSEKENRIAEFVYCESFIFRYISYLWSGSINCPPFLWGIIPQIDLSKEWTDKELYELFDLTEEEIAHIEEVIK